MNAALQAHMLSSKWYLYMNQQKVPLPQGRAAPQPERTAWQTVWAGFHRPLSSCRETLCGHNLHWTQGSYPILSDTSSSQPLRFLDSRTIKSTLIQHLNQCRNLLFNVSTQWLLSSCYRTSKYSLISLWMVVMENSSLYWVEITFLVRFAYFLGPPFM